MESGAYDGLYGHGMGAAYGPTVGMYQNAVNPSAGMNMPYFGGQAQLFYDTGRHFFY